MVFFGSIHAQSTLNFGFGSCLYLSPLFSFLVFLSFLVVLAVVGVFFWID